MFVTKLSELISTSKYILYNDITLDSQLTFEKLLGDDLYVTYQGLLDNKKVVIKLYIFDRSDGNNEIEVLDYLQSKSNGFPIPYMSISYPNLSIKDDIIKMIVYEYIEGENLISNNVNMLRLREDVEKQLNILHKLDLTFADIRLENVIKLSNNSYFLIDYGRVFSLTNKDFPPMDYMFEENSLPTQQDDIDKLYTITKTLEL